VTASLERRRRQGPGYQTVLIRSGREFNPAMGFIQRRDFTQIDQVLSYSWIPGDRSRLLWHTFGVRGGAFFRNADGSLESFEGGPEWSFGTRPGASGSVGATALYEHLVRPFGLSPDAIVPAGEHTFYQMRASYRMPFTYLLQTGVSLVAGGFYDGWQVSAGVTPSWFVSPHLELGSGYQYNRIRFSDRGQEFDAHVARLRIGTAFNTQVSTNAFVQYNSATDSFSANIRFRYNFREGNDLWVVYNEGLNTDRFAASPHLPLSDSRTFLVKYTHTFAM
jgi:hypothetical protein